MTNVKCIITKYNSDGVTPNSRKTEIPINAVVRRDGERALDTADFTFTAKTNITNTDVVTYIQDIVDTSNLRFIHNFQEAGIDYKNSNKYTIREESGYDVDMYSTNTSSRFGYSDNGLVMAFSANGDECISNVADPQFVGTSTSILDFSGMFDIYIRLNCSDSTANNKYVFSKDDGTNGISIYLSTAASSTVKVDLTVGGIISNITGAIVVNDSNYHWVRVYRDDTNVVTLQVDGVNDGTVSTSGNYNNTGQKLILGNNSASNRYFRGGHLSCVRIYCGGILSDSDNSVILKSRRILQTMKFGGVVWKIVDGTDTKTVSCRAFSQVLINTQVNPTVATNLYSSKTANQIITDLLTNYASVGTSPYINFVLFDRDLSSHSYTNYVATGSLISNIIYFCLVNNATFHTSPRRILTVESTNFNNTDSPNVILFKNTIHKITIDAFDDTSTTNDIEVMFGNIPTARRTETFTATASQTVFTLSGSNPYNVKVTDNGVERLMDTGTSPAANTFVVDYYNKTVTMSTGVTLNHTIAIEYSYEDPTAGNSAFFRTSDGTSISQNGRYFKRVIIQGVFQSDVSEINSFATNFITKYKTINQRVTVTCPILINSLRENVLVNVIDTVKKINTTNYTVKDVNNNDLAGANSPKVVRAMEWYYPEGRTDIHIGDYMYDSYDLENVTADQIIQTQKGFIQNKIT